MLGDRIVVAPAPDDPIAAAEGALADAFGTVDLAVLRRDAREAGPSRRRRNLGIARGAAEVRARHYHRASRPISLAGAVLIGSAGSRDRVATAEPDVLAGAEAEGIDTEPLPQQG